MNWPDVILLTILLSAVAIILVLPQLPTNKKTKKGGEK